VPQLLANVQLARSRNLLLRIIHAYEQALAVAMSP
jgi:hypothetical protein